MANPPKFTTLGCRLNAYEGEVMKAEAEKAGLDNTIIINTCAVTSEAVRQAKAFADEWKGKLSLAATGGRLGDALRQYEGLEELLGRDALDRYETALAGLDADERELIVGRLEFHCSFQELADTTGRASPDAARMAFKRALLRLAGAMDEGEPVHG